LKNINYKFNREIFIIVTIIIIKVIQNTIITINKMLENFKMFNNNKYKNKNKLIHKYHKSN
jgi:hypothetical protein